MRFGKFLILALALVLFAIPLRAQMVASDHERSCEEMLEGHRYAFVFQGFVDLSSFGAVGLTPNAGGGLIRFHHDGKFSAVTNMSIGGLPVLNYVLKGTYTMEENNSTDPPVCSGKATADDGTTLQLVVSRDARVLEQMHTDKGLVVVLTSLPMEQGPCTEATLHGTYVYSANGFFATSGLMQPFGSYTPFAFSGVISFDGKGHLTGWDTVSLGGQIVPRTYSGTYTMNADCTGTSEALDSLGNQFTTVSYVYDDAKAITVVNTSFGTVLAFNATRK